MAVDEHDIRKIALLARLAIKDEEVPHLQNEVNAILAFVAQLDDVDVTGIEPMTSIGATTMPRRRDVVTQTNTAEMILSNAPATEDGFFVVPKVVE